MNVGSLMRNASPNALVIWTGDDDKIKNQYIQPNELLIILSEKYIMHITYNKCITRHGVFWISDWRLKDYFVEA
jgi:hypothetical protein